MGRIRRRALGALFFGGFVVLGWGWLRSGWGTEDRIIGAALLQALGVVALMAVVDFPLQIASIQLDVAVLLGAGLVVRGLAARKNSCDEKGTGNHFAAAASGLEFSCAARGMNYHPP